MAVEEDRRQFGPSPLVLYRLTMLWEMNPEAHAEVAGRVMQALEFSDLSEADQTVMLEAEVAYNATGGKFGVGVAGLRDYALEDRIIDEEGILGLADYPLPTPPGMPGIAGVPFYTDDWVLHSNPVDGIPDQEKVTDDPGDYEDDDEGVAADGDDLEGWVGV